AAWNRLGPKYAQEEVHDCGDELGYRPTDAAVDRKLERCLSTVTAAGHHEGCRRRLLEDRRRRDESDVRSGCKTEKTDTEHHLLSQREECGVDADGHAVDVVRHLVFHGEALRSLSAVSASVVAHADRAAE